MTREMLPYLAIGYLSVLVSAFSQVMLKKSSQKEHKSILSGGIMHCFSGSWEIAREYLKLGFYISFAGPVTFKKAPKLQEAARNVPLERLLIETDSPYMAPEPVRGRRNEPGNVRYIAEKIAELRGMPFEELAERTTQNARNLFAF